MAAKSMKATQSASASALKIAASMTLKGTENTRGTVVSKDPSTLKLSASGATMLAGDHTMRSEAGLDATVKKPTGVLTMWEPQQESTLQGKHLATLAGKVDGVGGLFETEAQSHKRQSALVEELHEDQMRRLDEIGFEINNAIAELTAYMDDFIQNSRNLLGGTFDGLHTALRQRIDGLMPRLRELEERGQSVSAGLEEERAARTREFTEVLVPLREQIEKLASGLQKEEKVRETRNAELQQKMDQAVAALDAALDTEIASREHRITETAKEWRDDQEQLERRQEKLESRIAELKDKLFEETDLEREQRMGAQDPIVEALAGFIQKFQANAREQSLLGH